MTYLTTIINLLVSLKDFIFAGFLYFSGKSKGKQEQINKDLKKTIVRNKEYLENAEEVSRMSDDSVFDELRSNWSKK